jgi:hypothetical protein
MNKFTPSSNDSSRSTNRGHTPRVATFFILAGIAFLVTFVGYSLSNSLRCNLLLFSAIAFYLGYWFHRRPAPHLSSGRFGIFSRARERRRQREEEKKQPQKK